MKYDFNEDLAKLYWVEESIMFSNITWWVKINEANERNFYDWKYWTYNSMEAYAKLFPFWTSRQIQRILANLKQHDLIITWNYNKSPYDRTIWYAISPNGEIYLTKQSNLFDETVRPIPDNNTYNKPLLSKSTKVDIDNKEKEEVVNINNKDITGVVVDIKKENKNKEISESLEKLLKFWNIEFWTRLRLTEDLKTEFIKFTKKYSQEDFKYSFDNYKKYIKANTWYTNRFSLYDFLKQKNWFIQYFNK